MTVPSRSADHVQEQRIARDCGLERCGNCGNRGLEVCGAYGARDTGEHGARTDAVRVGLAAEGRDIGVGAASGVPLRGGGQLRAGGREVGGDRVLLVGRDGEGVREAAAALRGLAKQGK